MHNTLLQRVFLKGATGGGGGGVERTMKSKLIDKFLYG